MTTGSVITTGARALLSSGLLGPPSPIAAARLLREIYRGGTNLYTLLAISAARWPDRTAIIDDDGALSYREVRARTDGLANELVRNGVGPGQAVGVMCRNGRNFVTAVFAAASVGADVVLVNTEFRSNSLAGALSAHQIRIMFCDKEFTDQIGEADESIVAIDPTTVEVADDSRPKVAASGRLVLLTSGTTGVPKACRALLT